LITFTHGSPLDFFFMEKEKGSQKNLLTNFTGRLVEEE
jgi:hypothetical protein